MGTSWSLTTALTSLLVSQMFAAAYEPSQDRALQPATVLLNPWKHHIPPTKRQGVPGIERTAKGRLWAVDGRDVESTRNYQVLKYSDDDAKSWSEIKLMIMPRKGTRAMSPAIWIDPQKRLWVFWGQSFGLQDGRYGIWVSPDQAEPMMEALRNSGTSLNLATHRGF